MLQDPVCGMEIKDTSKAISLTHEGETYFFCTDLCKIQFEQNPKKYIKEDKEHSNHEDHHKT